MITDMEDADRTISCANFCAVFMKGVLMNLLRMFFRHRGQPSSLDSQDVVERKGSQTMLSWVIASKNDCDWGQVSSPLQASVSPAEKGAQRLSLLGLVEGEMKEA